MKWTPEKLKAFEDEIERIFAGGGIKAPVHLAGGNEAELIKIFENIKSYDWILCSWRSHYHCLLKGVPPKELKEAIIRGRSIALCFPEYRVLSSAIVGGICPIAVGIAWGLKQKGERGTVYAFIGDMTARTGIFNESYRYADGHDLPVKWVIEDNGKSVTTDTAEVWGCGYSKLDMNRYTYEMTRPHVGIGRFVSF